MRMRNPLLLLSSLCSVALLGIGLTGCDGGEILNNTDDRPKILSVRFIDNGEERDTEAGGQQVQMASSVVGPTGGCRNGGATAILKDIRLAIYMQVPNTQAELDIDAFLSLTGQDGLFTLSPVSIKSVNRPTTVYNTPGSAEGVIKVQVQLLFDDPGNFSPSSLIRGTATSGSSSLLVDDEGNFEVLGIQPGDVVQNTTDGSLAFVTGVLSDNSIEHTELQDGTRNSWLPGDSYSLTNASLCEGSGQVQYNYSLQVVVVDPEFRGDSMTLPIVVVDNVPSLCKASSTLCD